MKETKSSPDGVTTSEEAPLGAEESLVSNEESNLSELTGRTVSRRGCPRNLGPARMYLKGRWWMEPIQGGEVGDVVSSDVVLEPCKTTMVTRVGSQNVTEGGSATRSGAPG